MGDIVSFRYVVEDVKQVVMTIRGQCKEEGKGGEDLPVFLLGHSMGSLAALLVRREEGGGGERRRRWPGR